MLTCLQKYFFNKYYFQSKVWLYQVHLIWNWLSQGLILRLSIFQDFFPNFSFCKTNKQIFSWVEKPIWIGMFLFFKSCACHAILRSRSRKVLKQRFQPSKSSKCRKKTFFCFSPSSIWRTKLLFFGLKICCNLEHSFLSFWLAKTYI